MFSDIMPLNIIAQSKELFQIFFEISGLILRFRVVSTPLKYPRSLLHGVPHARDTVLYMYSVCNEELSTPGWALRSITIKPFSHSCVCGPLSIRK